MGQPQNADRQQSGHDREWKCTSCGALLGKINTKPGSPQYGWLRIKYKELYVYTKGGEVRVTCPKCALDNSIADQDYVDYITKGTVQKRLHCEACHKDHETIPCPDCGSGINLPMESADEKQDATNKSEGGTKAKGG